MRWALLLFVGLSLGPVTPGVAAEGSRETHAASVVGLQVTYQVWDEDRPWMKRTPEGRSAVAVVVGKGQLLTTAQMVDQATLIQLTTFGRVRSVEPRVIRSDADVNLALLAVDLPELHKELKPVGLADYTPASGTLRTVRWRTQQFESAASRVSRLEVERGWGGHVEHAFLHMRTDMTGGGWGEPVFADGELVGITLAQSEQTSRAIPVEIIRAFLDRARAPGEYVGFPALGLRWQVNRDANVSAFLGQTGESRGVLVRQIPWGTSACGVLKPRDILLELDGQELDAEGYYRHPRLGRLRFNHHLAEHRRPGDKIPVRVLREGKERRFFLRLQGYPADLNLVPTRRVGEPPYLIAGGLMLRELDVPYLRTWGNEWLDVTPIHLRTRYALTQAGQTADRRRIVLIGGVFPGAYNIGYQDLRDEVVERINGHEIGGLRDVVRALEAPRDGFHVIDLSADSTRGQVVLDAAGFEAATAEILEQYRVPAGFRLPDPPPSYDGPDCTGDY
jgi:S1-C subfamily serine protease